MPSSLYCSLLPCSQCPNCWTFSLFSMSAIPENTMMKSLIHRTCPPFELPPQSKLQWRKWLDQRAGTVFWFSIHTARFLFYTHYQEGMSPSISLQILAVVLLSHLPCWLNRYKNISHCLIWISPYPERFPLFVYYQHSINFMSFAIMGHLW